MAKFHLGAFAGSLHGSTKSTTFRRNKSGIVAYDRQDPHSAPRTGTGDSAAPSRNKAAMILAGLFSAKILPVLKQGGVDTKFGSVYNKLMQNCFEQEIPADWLTNVRSPFYGKNNMGEVREILNQSFDNIDDFGTAFGGYAIMLYSGSADDTNVQLQGKFQNGNNGYTVTKDAEGKVTVHAFDGVNHTVSLTVIDGETGVPATLSGTTGTAIATAASLNAISSVTSPFYGKKIGVLLIKVDGKKIAETYDDAWLMFQTA